MDLLSLVSNGFLAQSGNTVSETNFILNLDGIYEDLTALDGIYNNLEILDGNIDIIYDFE